MQNVKKYFYPEFVSLKFHLSDPSGQLTLDHSTLILLKAEGVQFAN